MYLTVRISGLAGQHVVESASCCLLQPWGDVAVGVQGDSYCGVPQPFLNYLGVHSLLQQ